jgi:type 1 glutamine amidotransferase
MSEAIRTLLIGRGHNFETLGPILRDALAETAAISVTMTTDWDEFLPENVGEYDVVVDYVVDYETEMTDAQRRGLLSFVEGGGGYVGLHGAAAMFGVPEDGDPALLEEQAAMLGGRLVDHPGVVETRTEIVDRTHPITREMDSFTLVDEPYAFEYDEASVRVLAETTHESFGTMPVAWTKRYGDGRVFYYAAGHDERSFESEPFQTLVRRGVEWAANRD